MSLWRNPAPSSTRFCRPIKIQYEKESPQLIQNVRDDVENQIKALKKAVFLIYNDQTMPIEVRTKFELSLTMIDGKAVNAITNNTSTRTCNICMATPIQMNKKHALEKLQTDPKMLKYGLSALHAYIRCFECILHISYRLPIKMWQIRGNDAQKKCNAQKILEKNGAFG